MKKRLLINLLALLGFASMVSCAPRKVASRSEETTTSPKADTIVKPDRPIMVMYGAPYRQFNEN